MNRAQFEIYCEDPEITLNSINIDDVTDVKYNIKEKMILFEIEVEKLSLLAKISQSVLNKIQLVSDTIKKFKKD